MCCLSESGLLTSIFSTQNPTSDDTLSLHAREELALAVANSVVPLFDDVTGQIPGKHSTHMVHLHF